MSNWANSNPEKMAEISQLPPSQQNDALRDAIGWDPDYIRDQQKEEAFEEDVGTTPSLPTGWSRCTGCGASYRNPDLTLSCRLCGGRPSIFMPEEEE